MKTQNVPALKLGDFYSFNELTSHRLVDSLPPQQVPYIESLLRDESEHIDWRRLLLSAALPWPSPSVPQLLAVLEGFKAVDSDLTGYVSEDQYLQVCYAIQLSLMSSQNHFSALHKHRLSSSINRWSYGSVTAPRTPRETHRKCRLANDLMNYAR